MYDQIREDTTFIMLYAVVTAMAAMASIYLLRRRGNAFVAGITTPRRLRRWTAVFFAVMAVGHVWYIPSMVLDSSEEVQLCLLIGGLLDCLLTIPLVLVVMLCMLQDRRRPLWPVGVMVAPLVLGVIACIVTRSEALTPWLRGYFLLASLGFTIYMVRAVMQYGHWLRDNYTDLENKEVWKSFVVLAVVMLMFDYYVLGYGGMIYEYVVQVCGIVLICLLLWRVETLQALPAPEDVVRLRTKSSEMEESDDDADVEDIGPLLRQHCEDTLLYLQRDLTLSHLAQAIGTNRTYLSQYFSGQNTTYNAYINTLRVDHFIRLYREATAAGLSVTAQQLASESGYRSYSTFSQAFKQHTGQSVTAWIREEGCPTG